MDNRQICTFVVLLVCIGVFPGVVYHLTDGACVAKETLALTSIAWSGGALIVGATCIALFNSAVTCALWLLGSSVLLVTLETLLLVVVNITFIECYTKHELQTINAVGGVALTGGWTAIAALRIISICKSRETSTQQNAPA